MSLRAALTAFHQEGTFSESDYQALRRVLARALSHADSRSQGDLLDGLVNLFFERHLLDDRRRLELLAMDEAELERALRHRFRQLVADERDEHQPYHALRQHVREVLSEWTALPPAPTHWPVSLREQQHFVRASIEQAVCALWEELGRKPNVSEASAELFGRYVRPLQTPDEFTQSRSLPDSVVRRIDGLRMATAILELLSPHERSLLRHVLSDEGSVEEWAGQNQCSRATGYRYMARLKALCRLEFKERSNGTRLEFLNALRAQL